MKGGHYGRPSWVSSDAETVHKKVEMALRIAKSEEELLQPLGPPAPLEEDYWPFVNSVAGTALLSLVSQFAVSISLALQWNVPVESRRWGGIFPYLVFRANRIQFEEIMYWSMLLSAIFLAIFSLSGFLTGQRLQVQAGRQFAWVDIFLIGLVVLLRYYLTGFDIGAVNLAWGLMAVGLIGFVVGSRVVHGSLLRRRRVHSSYPSQLDQGYV